jgi:DNA adenine methylase
MEHKSLIPLFGRIGAKRSFLKLIERLIPEHDIYVEPFFGGGSVFWNKLEAEEEIINDLDPLVYDALRYLKRLDLKRVRDETQEIAERIPSTIKAIQDFVDKDYTDIRYKFIKSVLLLNNTFSAKGIGKIFNESNPFRVKKVENYWQRIKSAIIRNKNYNKIITEYDSPNTFFFIDPPYENSQGLYRNSGMNFIKLKEQLDKIKGRFLLTLNYSKNIKDLFKGYKIRKVKKVSNNSGVIGSTPRYELFITNYE